MHWDVGIDPDAMLGFIIQRILQAALVMLAMSAVELGTLRASPDLVEAAIARLKPTP